MIFLFFIWVTILFSNKINNRGEHMINFDQETVSHMTPEEKIWWFCELIHDVEKDEKNAQDFWVFFLGIRFWGFPCPFIFSLCPKRNGYNAHEITGQCFHSSRSPPQQSFLHFSLIAFNGVSVIKDLKENLDNKSNGMKKRAIYTIVKYKNSIWSLWQQLRMKLMRYWKKIL